MSTGIFSKCDLCLKGKNLLADRYEMMISSKLVAGRLNAPALSRFKEVFVSRVRSEWDRLRGATRNIVGPISVRHALAARERGNFEAAFWLLTEAFDWDRENLEISVNYWTIALLLGRVDIASPAGVWLVCHYASKGECELAAGYWLDLIGAAPDVLVPAATIAEILPALKSRLAEADEEEAMSLRGPLRRAMRHAVDPRNGSLHPGVAMRLFEEGRSVNPEAARRAAEVALKSPNLNEKKRERILKALAPESASRFELVEAVPVAFGEDSLVLSDVNGGEQSIPFKSIEAVAVAEVSGLAEYRVVLIDLICQLRASAEGAEPIRVVRVRGDRFDPAKLIDGPCLPGGELPAFLGQLLEHTRAASLPNLESALGVQFARYATLAEYEQEVLSVA